MRKLLRTMGRNVHPRDVLGKRKSIKSKRSNIFQTADKFPSKLWIQDDAPVKILMQPKYANSAMNQGQICYLYHLEVQT